MNIKEQYMLLAAQLGDMHIQKSVHSQNLAAVEEQISQLQTQMIAINEANKWIEKANEPIPNVNTENLPVIGDTPRHENQ